MVLGKICGTFWGGFWRFNGLLELRCSSGLNRDDEGGRSEILVLLKMPRCGAPRLRPIDENSGEMCGIHLLMLLRVWFTDLGDSLGFLGFFEG